MTPRFDDLLPPLCREFGVDTEYWDIWGRLHHPDQRALLAILSSSGLDTRSPEHLAASAKARERARATRPLDEVTVVSMGAEAPTVALRAPSGARLELVLRWEDGFTARQSSVAGDGQTELALPKPLRLGYHDLELTVMAPDAATKSVSSRLIVVPERAWQPPVLAGAGRAAGLAVSLYGLRSARNWGAGDFTDLAELTGWVAGSLGAGFIALNPLHAIHNRAPFNTSPYLPLSACHRNPLYLDVETVEDFTHCPAAQRLVASAAFQTEVAALRNSEFVEYERVWRLKRVVLRLLWRRFEREEWRQNTARAHAFRAWIGKQGELLDRYAAYCALDEVLHARDRSLWMWPDWPEEYRDPGSPAVAEFVRQHQSRVLFHKYAQYQVDLQLAAVQRKAREHGMPIGLYHDVALATDRCGADLWAQRDFFVTGCRVGAPPDDFAPEGQDWAFPPPDWERHRADGYRQFAETIRRNARHGGALRLDHVMRFFRLFWIPEGLTPAGGTYVNERWRDLLGILALESVRGQFLVVGEDLGTVPGELRPAMERMGMLNYKLFYFEKGPDGLPTPCHEYGRNALVSSTTHDLPTLAGFWAARDIEVRRQTGILNDESLYQRQKVERIDEKRRMIEALVRDGFLPAKFPREAATWTELTGELHNAIIGYLASTPSALLLLNQEDLTKETEQQNVPGTTWQYPNWRRKMKYTVEELAGSPQVADFALMFRAWLERTGRLSESR